MQEKVISSFMQGLLKADWEQAVNESNPESAYIWALSLSWPGARLGMFLSVRQSQ